MLDAVKADGLLANGRSVLVLYSGGRDSTCLLDLAVRVAGRDAVRALHVNYGLRESAGADERHCSKTCGSLGVPLEVHRPRRPENGNLQAWARDVRYRAADELARRAPASPADLAAGHTATDQVETILYRLASSPSRRALLGMRPREGNLVRPLLRFTREQTAEYCVARGLSWREDETNSSRAYARGRIRSELVPALRAVHPAAEENVLALADQLRDEAEVLDALVDQVLDGKQSIALKTLRELPPALRRLIVQRLADRAVGGPAPGAARRADEVAALRGVHPAAEENVLALADQLRDEAEVLDALVDQVLDGKESIALRTLRELPPALRRLIVQRLADRAVGGPAPGAARRADEVAALSEHGTAALDLPHGVRALARQGKLQLVRQSGGRQQARQKPKARSARP